MPYAAPARCTISGCNQYAVRRGRCQGHVPVWTHKSKHTQELSSSEQSKFRRAVLAREPDCRHCGAPATDADHITPIAEGGARTSLTNGQALCHSCHSIKSKQEAKRGQARARARRNTQRHTDTTT